MVQHIVTWDGVDVDRRGLDCGMEGKKENMERDENRRERFFWFFWWWPWSSAAAPGRLAAREHDQQSWDIVHKSLFSQSSAEPNVLSTVAGAVPVLMK